MNVDEVKSKVNKLLKRIESVAFVYGVEVAKQCSVDRFIELEDMQEKYHQQVVDFVVGLVQEVKG